MLREGLHAKAVGGDAGEAAGHGLQHRHAPRLVARREQQRIVAPVQCRQQLLQKTPVRLTTAAAKRGEWVPL